MFDEFKLFWKLFSSVFLTSLGLFLKEIGTVFGRKFEINNIDILGADPGGGSLAAAPGSATVCLCNAKRATEKF